MNGYFSFFFFFSFCHCVKKNTTQFIKLGHSIGNLRNNMTQAAYIHIPASIKDFRDMTGTHFPTKEALKIFNLGNLTAKGLITHISCIYSIILKYLLFI